jgi:hydroxymethylglutaryl-CoA lyase
MTPTVRIHEVAPRDGLQNEAAVLSTDAKIALIESLVGAGVRDLEVTSFVHPRWVPQLADAKAVISRLPRFDGVRYWALVPNQRGFDRAVETGVAHIATVVSVSDTHNRKNLNRTRRETLAAQAEIVGAASDESIRVRCYISTAFGCPFEGQVSEGAVVEVAHSLIAVGADVIVLGDTTGLAHPVQIRALLHALQDSGIELSQIAAHFHDNRGTALLNAITAYESGVRTLDASVAGTGGCPYAPGAAGNLATEDLVGVFDAMGVETGIDLQAVCEAGAMAEDAIGRELPGRLHRYYMGVRVRSNESKSA